jgi:23S rRNA pseudouridine1911/1915/1917 synthase
VHSLLNEYVRAAGSGAQVWCVHRLDRDASGLLVLAKTESAWRWLKDDFRARRVKKAYAVLVEGRVDPPAGRTAGDFETIQSFLRENARNRMEPVGEHSTAEDDDHASAAKLAVTRYRVEQAADHCTLLRVETDTGRKHQIRVHLAQIGHPVVGDVEYGSPAARRGESLIGRLGLHACELAFCHPHTGQTMRFESLPPERFVRAVRSAAPVRAEPRDRRRTAPPRVRPRARTAGAPARKRRTQR